MSRAARLGGGWRVASIVVSVFGGLWAGAQEPVVVADGDLRNRLIDHLAAAAQPGFGDVVIGLAV